ncbi:MAG TPA: class I SAM-dependent methyltransferase [Acidimicrobiales bacterium]|nr:class I SAM-dependent methyltransferase [Acidimicrobiales bacterium]
MADIIRLEPIDVPDPGEEAPGPGGPDHPMRKVTRQVAFEEGGWSGERSAKVAALFDGLSEIWHQNISDERHAPLLDALARGNPGRGPVVELGCGLCDSTPLLERHIGPVVAVDLSMGMLQRATPDVARVRGDAGELPLPSNCAGSVVMINALLFPEEVDRILAPGGTVVWVNTVGESTPIHLPAEDVARALPGDWSGVWSTAGHGLWGVFRRSAESVTG